MKRLLISFVPLCIPILALAGGPPDPAASSISPADAMNGLYVSPNGFYPPAGTILTVSVRDANDEPVENASVTLTAPGVVWCSDAATSGTTDESGDVVLLMFGSACVSDTPGAVTVVADGVTIASYENIKTPDAGPDSDGAVTLADVIFFTQQYCGIATPDCHDYDNDDDTDLLDFVFFASAFLAVPSCP